MPICYKDMTFCPFHNTCVKGKECFRSLTDDVVKAAEEFGLPTAQYVDPPECHTPYITEKEMYDLVVTDEDYPEVVPPQEQGEQG